MGENEEREGRGINKGRTGRGGVGVALSRPRLSPWRKDVKSGNNVYISEGWHTDAPDSL